MNKKFNLFTFLYCLSFVVCFSQNHSRISINEVTINQNIVYGINTASLITLFGEPINIENDFLEMENATSQIYNYHGAMFWFLYDKLISFKIIGNNYDVFDHNLTVGQNINNLESLFPHSFQNRSGNSIIINILEFDNYIYIEYTDFNTIRTIEHRSY